ncbi:hypothetical protein CDAR_70351 [Caerostris darwini]|uniref:Uncharacterized protein n=1 Tax=Caerostris darwini TaxID=1538125 RepID=A0AAV4WN57_9ARAC|nr:hypothetical protein CDAR_70351 [Caerostris darwini]
MHPPAPEMTCLNPISQASPCIMPGVEWRQQFQTSLRNVYLRRSLITMLLEELIFETHNFFTTFGPTGLDPDEKVTLCQCRHPLGQTL